MAVDAFGLCRRGVPDVCTRKKIGSPPGKAPWGRKESPVHDRQSRSHVRWDCKHHVVIVPKYRKKLLYGQLRHHVGPTLKELCRQKGIEVVEGHVMPDHVHMCLPIPPKYGVAFVLGFLKGKSAVRIHRQVGERRLQGLHFWAVGYCVSTVGLDEQAVREYIRQQEKLATGQNRFEFG
jgi:putative transposase